MLKSYISCTLDFRYQQAFRSSALSFSTLVEKELHRRSGNCNHIRSPPAISNERSNPEQYHSHHQHPRLSLSRSGLKLECASNAPIALHFSGLTSSQARAFPSHVVPKIHIEPSRSLIPPSPARGSQIEANILYTTFLAIDHT